jgi:hypothetical protein
MNTKQADENVINEIEFFNIEWCFEGAKSTKKMRKAMPTYVKINLDDEFQYKDWVNEMYVECGSEAQEFDNWLSEKFLEQRYGWLVEECSVTISFE